MRAAGVNEFIFWADFRKYHQKIIAIGERSAGEISACIAHSAEREAVFTRANKAVLRLLFSLKDTISVDQWERCFDALEAASVKGAPDSALEVAPPLEIPQSETAPSFGAPSFSAPKLSWFPFFQNISGKRALVAGGGKIAARRVKSLLKFDCTIEVISPVMCAQIETLAASNGGKLTLTRRVWQEGDCRRADFVTLATDEREVNERAARECKNANIPVSVADAQEESSFFFPALAVRGNVVVGISSGGTNHKEARDAAEKIRTVLGDK
jgi:siroheme synthase-like protein